MANDERDEGEGVNAQGVEGEKPMSTYERRLASGEKRSTSDAPSMNAMAPYRLSHRIRVIAHMAALGLSNREIAGRTGYTEGRISIVLRSIEVTEEVERTRKEIFSRSDAQALVTMLPKAYETIWETLRDDGAARALRVDTSFKIIERLHGKPKQSVDVGGTLLKDVFAMLDRQASAFEKFAPKAEQAIDVTDSGAPGADGRRTQGTSSPRSASGASRLSPDPRASDYFSRGEDAMSASAQEGPGAKPANEFEGFLDEFSGKLGAVPKKTERKA